MCITHHDCGGGVSWLHDSHVLGETARVEAAGVRSLSANTAASRHRGHVIGWGLLACNDDIAVIRKHQSVSEGNGDVKKVEAKCAKLNK